MQTEDKIIQQIIALEGKIFDNKAYLEESEQSKLQTLYQLIGRTLTDNEKALVYSKRLDFMHECLGDIEENFLNKKMYYES